MNRVLVIGVVLWVAMGCGDNSKQCGPGTVDTDGTCTPTAAACGPGTQDDGTGQCVVDGSVICTDGTKLDPATGRCVVDPASCHDGTVLVHGACVDPGHVHADIQEAHEPNGLGLLGEASTSPAGAITLGTSFVIHGLIEPFQDANNDGQNDADIDTYTVTVTGPTLVHVTADGVNGLAAGFMAVASVSSTDALFTWQRLGINLEGDTSKRQVLLPRAGTYLIGIADTRSLVLAGAAAGNHTTEYYVTIDALDLPVPASFDLAQGVIGSVTDGIKLLTPGQLGAGVTQLHLAMPLAAAKASIVVLNQGSFLTFANETQVTGTADVTFSGIQPGDSTVIAVDFVFNYALEPADFVLTGMTQ
jgi:hypothetical protein